MTSHWHRPDEFRWAGLQAPISIVDRLYTWRDRLLSSPRFQRFSARLPLTRGISQREARSLFDLCAGFVYSQVLTACIELDLFARVQEEPKTLERLAAELTLPSARLERLLLAAVTLRLISQRSGNRFGLGMLGAALIGNPGVAAMVKHHALLYRDLHDPVALLRGPVRDAALARYWRYAGSRDVASLDADDVADYSQLMASTQSLIADDVLDAYAFGRHRCLLDVGGGEGAFVASAAAQNPDLRFILFDLPAVADRAAACFAAGDNAGRVTVTKGSFLHDPLPKGADVISLVRVVHDHDDRDVAKLLEKAFAALPPGGQVVIAEPMAGVAGAEPVGHAYFGMYLLAMGSGRPRTALEIRTLLERAGFARVVPCRTRRPMLVSVIAAQKPHN